MKKYLTLIRHAKSSWNQSGLVDFERPLNNRGLKNAPEMGKRLADAGYAVETIISSPAVRAISTAEIIANEIGFAAPSIVQNAVIYDASLATLVHLVNSFDDRLTRVMLVGHNPGFTILCNYLSDSNIDNLPTCSIVQISFEISSWGDITEHTGELIDFDYPKK